MYMYIRDPLPLCLDPARSLRFHTRCFGPGDLILLIHSCMRLNCSLQQLFRTDCKSYSLLVLLKTNSKP